MIIFKTTFFLLFVPFCIASAAPEDVPEIAEATRPQRRPSRPLLKRQEKLSPNAPAALQNAQTITNFLKDQYLIAHRELVQTILNAADAELTAIERGQVLSRWPSPPPVEALIREEIERRRPPSPLSESPEKERRDALSHAAETASLQALPALMETFFKTVESQLFHISLRRLNAEQWARVQLFEPPALSFKGVDDVLTGPSEERRGNVKAALGELFMAIQSLKEILPSYGNPARMSPNTFNKYIDDHTVPWSLTDPQDAAEEETHLQLMKETLSDALDEYNALLAEWKASIPLPSIPEES